MATTSRPLRWYRAELTTFLGSPSSLASSRARALSRPRRALRTVWISSAVAFLLAMSNVQFQQTRPTPPQLVAVRPRVCHEVVPHGGGKRLSGEQEEIRQSPSSDGSPRIRAARAKWLERGKWRGSLRQSPRGVARAARSVPRSRLWRAAASRSRQRQQVNALLGHGGRRSVGNEARSRSEGVASALDSRQPTPRRSPEMGWSLPYSRSRRRATLSGEPPTLANRKVLRAWAQALLRTGPP